MTDLLQRRLVLDTMLQVWLLVHGFERMTRAEFVAMQRKARRHKLAGLVSCGCELCLDKASLLMLR